MYKMIHRILRMLGSVFLDSDAHFTLVPASVLEAFEEGLHSALLRWCKPNPVTTLKSGELLQIYMYVTKGMFLGHRSYTFLPALKKPKKTKASYIGASV